jgi:predicted acetyltransferase
MTIDRTGRIAMAPGSELPAPRSLRGRFVNLEPRGLYLLTDARMPVYDFDLTDRQGEVIGNASLIAEDDPDRLGAAGNFGCDIAEAHRGKGRATQAILLVEEFAREVGLSRLVMTGDPDNLGTHGACRNAGGRLLDEVPAQASAGAGTKVRYVKEL